MRWMIGCMVGGLFLLGLPGVLQAEEDGMEVEGPDGEHWATDLDLKQPPPPMTDAQMARNVRMQKGGFALLGIGVGGIVVGATLVEIDGYGKVGLSGFIGLGSGITIMSVGMILLGISRPVHYREVREHQIAAWRPENGQGLVVSYGHIL